jgi:hypothetical protein
MDTHANSPHTDDSGSNLSRNAKKKVSKKKILSSCDGCTLKNQSSHTLMSSHDSDADSEEDGIEVIEKPAEEPGEELGE